jgi:hypothetical protein
MTATSSRNSPYKNLRAKERAAVATGIQMTTGTDRPHPYSTWTLKTKYIISPFYSVEQGLGVIQVVEQLDLKRPRRPQIAPSTEAWGSILKALPVWTPKFH